MGNNGGSVLRKAILALDCADTSQNVAALAKIARSETNISTTVGGGCGAM